MRKIDGRGLARRIRDKVRQDIETTGTRPTLGVLLVGDDPASHIYVNLKEKACAEAGTKTDIRRLPATTPERELRDIIRSWNADADVDAILIQIPLPKTYDQDAIILEMDPKKDVDGFHPENYAALLAGTSGRFPPVHEAILRLIGETDVPVNGADAVILGNSETFMAPLKRLLERGGAAVEVFGADDYDAEAVKHADIVVVAVGRVGFLTAGMVKPGAVVVDVGTNRTPDGNVVGDVDAAGVENVPGWISPVPGGVGPVTVALLLKNTLELARSQ